MLEAASWVLIIELMSLAALPLAFLVFRRLPDKGYAFAKILGLLLTAWSVWFLGMLGLPFNQRDSWVVFAVLFIALDTWLLLRKGGGLRRELLEFFTTKIWLIVAMELVFVLVYVYGVNLHSYTSAIRNTEKPGDFAFFNSLVLNTQLPPSDPWMSGYNINYYYFSHFVIAMLTKMMGTAPVIAFDLSIPLVMGLVAIECFGLVYNLVAAARQRSGAIVGVIALLAVLFVDFLGNLDGLRQIIAPRLDMHETPLSNFVFNSWLPSRVIYDYIPIPTGSGITWTWTETINEFPMFSYMLADMHPHVLSLPFMLLAVLGALNIFGATAGSNLFNLRRAEGILTWLVLALSCGAFIFINTWDYPTFLLLVLLAAFVSERRAGVPILTATGGKWFGNAGKLFLLGGPLPENGLAWGRTVRYLGFAARLVVTSVVLYLPFLLTFTSLIGDNPLPESLNVPFLSTIGHIVGIVAWNRTPLYGYFLVFGVFIFPMLSFLAIKAWPYLKNPYSYMADYNPETEPVPARLVVSLNLGLLVTGVGLVLLLASELFYLAGVNVFICLGLGILSAPITAIGAGTLMAYLLEQVRPARPAFELRVALVAVCLLMIGCGYYQHFELYGPLIICITFAVGILLNENSGVRHNPARSSLLSSDSFVLLLMILTGVINFAIEIFFLRDIYNSRFNTLFKFYYQSWLLYGLSAAYCVWRTVDWAWNLRVRQLERSQAVVAGETMQLPVPMPVILPAFSRQLQPQLVGAGIYQGQPRNYQASYSPAVIETETSPTYTQPDPANDDDYDDYVIAPPSPLELDNQAKDELDNAARQVKNKSGGKHWWRWLWVFVMAALVMGGLVYTLLGPYEWNNHYAERQGLNGEDWYKRDYPGDYEAVQWLRAQAKINPNFRDTMLEATGQDWVDYSLVSTFSSFPTVMGWSGHEIQWRGGNSATLAEVAQRTYDVETIYSTLDVNQAKALLKKYKVKYVYVGSIETSASSANSGRPKNYAPEALAKFAQFMHPIYNSNGVTIYSF